MAEVSLVELATIPPSRKGSHGHPPKVWKCDARRRGEVYSLLNEAQNVMSIVGRAVPWSLRAKNREKVRAQSYFLVCLPLTRNADRLKRLEGHERGTKKC